MRSLVTKLFVLPIACGIVFGTPTITMKFDLISYPGSQDTRLQSINNGGQMAGFYDGTHGFIYDRGTFTTLDYPGAIWTQPFHINDHGQVVGVYEDDGGTHGFMCRHGVFSPLDVPEATATEAYGINNRGQIVGEYLVGESRHGWVLDKGGYSDIELPGADQIHARGINDRGQVAGWYYMDGQLGGGYLYDRGEFFLFNEVDGVPPRFWDINTRGQLAGTIWGPGRACVVYRENVTIIEIPDSVSTVGRGINDSGRVVGFYRIDNSDGTSFYGGFVTR